MHLIRSDHFLFGLVFIKKITKIGFFKKTRNQTETNFGSVQLFWEKIGSN
jgi:hypothetical protein